MGSTCRLHGTCTGHCQVISPFHNLIPRPLGLGMRPVIPRVGLVVSSLNCTSRTSTDSNTLTELFPQLHSGTETSHRVQILDSCVILVTTIRTLSISLVPRPQEEEKKRPGTNCTRMRQHFRKIYRKMVRINRMRMKYLVNGLK